MPDIRGGTLLRALEAMGAAHQQIIPGAVATVDAHLAAQQAPQITEAPRDAANAARPAPPADTIVDKPLS